MLYLQSLIFGAPTESTEPQVPGAAASSEAAEAVGRESKAEVATDGAGITGKDGGAGNDGAGKVVKGANGAASDDEGHASGDEWVLVDEWTRKSASASAASPKKRKVAPVKEEAKVEEEEEAEKEEEAEEKEKEEAEEEEALPVPTVEVEKEATPEIEAEVAADVEEAVKQVLEEVEEKKAEEEEEKTMEEEFVMEMEEPAIEAPRMEMPRMEMPRLEMPRMEVPKLEVPKLEVPKVEMLKSEGKRLPSASAEKPKRNKRQKSSAKGWSAPQPPRLPFAPALNPVAAGAWCSKPGMTYAEKLKANVRTANPTVVVRMEERLNPSRAPAPPRVPPTSDSQEDSIYGCIASLYDAASLFDAAAALDGAETSLYDAADRSAIEEAIASAVASPSPNHSNFSGTPGRCCSPAPSDASTDTGSDWLITPPPCFLRSGSAPAPSTNPLENLLIEHPSMSVYVRPFEANAGGFSSMSYSFLSSRVDNRLHDVIDIDSDLDDDDDDEDVENCDVGLPAEKEEEEKEEEEEEKEEEVEEKDLKLVVEKEAPKQARKDNSSGSGSTATAASATSAAASAASAGLPAAVFSPRVLAPINASASRKTLPKGQLAKALAKRSHAGAAGAASASTSRDALVEAAMGVASSTTASPPPPPHSAPTHLPPTPLQLQAQKRRAQQKSKAAAASNRACARANAAYQAASLPRGPVSRRHKIAARSSGANNNRKCHTGTVNTAVIRC